MQWWCSAQGEPWTWAWQAYPGVWLFIGIIATGYARLLRRTRAAGGGAFRSSIALFATGLLLLWLSLDWPIGAIGAGYLASVHMVQFLLMGLIVPPLLLYGIPEQAYEQLPPRLLAVLTPVTRPVVAFTSFNLMVILTHLPPVVDTLMATQLGSFAIDMLWLGGGIIFWWPVCVGTPGGSQLRELAKVGYLGLYLIAMKPVFIYLTFSRFPQYATYELAPRISNISARADQQMAGLMMEVVGMIIILLAVGAVFLRWSAREARAETAPVQAAPAALADPQR
ncbi:MAG TPA: cytochrome c oxidase assembly protein [Longimicrobiales bacterium]|nr:cytochrome c oxidase assembly protein [Longimicrobiales bacterium]